MVGDILRKKKLYVLFFMIIFSVFITFSFENCDAASTFYVDDSGVRDYVTIQNAIEAASSGDIIYIFNGTYYENIIVDKSITFVGEAKETTIINGNLSGDVIHINADWVNISGFTILNSENVYPKSGINISSNYNMITGNIIINNYYGITMNQASYNIISENAISDNNHCGIYISFSSNNNISENTIKNHSYNGIGIYNAANANTIKGNKLTHNNFSGINIRLSSNNNIIGNTITENNVGIYVPSDRYKNHILDNIFSNNKKDIEKEFEIPISLMLFIIVGTSVLVILIFYWEQKRQKKETCVSEKTNHSLDTRGNLCPVPLIMTKKKIFKMKKGVVLEIITDDLVAKENIERYAEEKLSLVRIEEKDNMFKIYVKK